MSFPPKHPAKFAVGDRVLIVMGGYRGHLVNVTAVRPGWPYANYTVRHEVEGEMLLNERELGLHKETTDAAATPAGREARRVAERRRATGGDPPPGSEEQPGASSTESA